MLLLAYVVVGIAAMIYAWRGIVEEMGPIKDFGDFGTALYMVVGVGLIWPVFGLVYGLWLLYKSAQKGADDGKSTAHR